MKLMVFISLFLFSLTAWCESAVQTVKLKNGMEMLLIKDKSIPLIDLGLIIKNGSTSDPMAKGGLTTLTVDSWMENPPLDDAAALLGGEFQHFTSPDYILIAGSVFSEKRNEYLSLFFNLLTHPLFDKKSIERKKQQQISKIKRITEEPEAFAEMAFKGFLFGAHPYGLNSMGKVQDIQLITPTDVMKHYKRLWDPGQIIFIVTGDYDDDFKNALVAKLECLPSGAGVEVHWPKIPEIKNIQIEAIDSPDATQTQIILGHLGVERKNRDYLRLKLASVILGGAFTSRLNEKIRVQGGLTYNISSEFESELKGGSFQITTSTQNNNVEKVIQDSRMVLKEFIEKGVTQDELSSAKNYVVGMLSRSLETPEDHAIWTATEKLYGLSTRSLTDVVTEIKAVNLAELNEAIKEHMSFSKMKMTVMGPTKKYFKYLQSIGVVETKKASDL